MKLDADVIVVGAGPSGAMVASEIALGGASAITVERRSGPVESRAGTLLPRVLELFDARGIADRFIAKTNEILAFPFRPTHIYAGLKFANWEYLGSRFGFTLGLPQSHTEELLLAWAIEKGVDIRHGHEFAGLTQRDDHVEAEVTDSSGATTTLRARYLVGADGGRSAVRHALGLAFEGHGGTFTGIVADAEITAPWPVGHFGTDNVAGWLRGFAFGQRITRVDGLRSGRAFLVGESARIHYPASGVGMNFCPQDAFNLGWKLGAVVRGEAPDSLLDTYNSERMPVIERLFDSVRAQCALQFNFTDEGIALKRKFEGAHMPGLEVNRRLGLELNGIEEAYAIEDNQHPLAGRPVPDLDLVLPDGTLTRVGELLRGQQFLLLDLAGSGNFDPLAGRTASVRVVKAIASRRINGTGGIAAMLLRPDAYVAWASGQPVSARNAETSLGRWLPGCAGNGAPA